MKYNNKTKMNNENKVKINNSDLHMSNLFALNG